MTDQEIIDLHDSMFPRVVFEGDAIGANIVRFARAILAAQIAAPVAPTAGLSMEITEQGLEMMARAFGKTLCVPVEQKPLSLPGVRLPVDVMAGADWNILDSRGVRVAIAGSLEGDKWETNPALARALVDMINCAALAIKK